MPYMYSEMQNKLSKTRHSPLESMGQIISSRCPILFTYSLFEKCSCFAAKGSKTQPSIFTFVKQAAIFIGLLCTSYLIFTVYMLNDEIIFMIFLFKDLSTFI